MMAPLTITDTNLSVAWAKGFLAVMSAGGGTKHPAVITIDGIESTADIENQLIRQRLDSELKKHKQPLSSTVAGTLFPYSMWNPAMKKDADSLYARYETAWPGIAKCPANRNGVYFRRLTAFMPKNGSGRPVNQLKYVVDTYAGGNHRKSALQASILDPTRDHTNSPRRGFPCLQQVSFTPLSNDRLSVTGFYATQYQFQKAYGNYLGLYGLGKFMAKQLGLQLTQVVCMAAVLDLGHGPKTKLASLEKDMRSIVKQVDSGAT